MSGVCYILGFIMPIVYHVNGLKCHVFAMSKDCFISSLICLASYVWGLSNWGTSVMSGVCLTRIRRLCLEFF